jgi:hypothetical protein
MPTSDPRGPANGTTYVGRGGGWKSDPTWQRTSVRDWYEPANAGQGSCGCYCSQLVYLTENCPDVRVCP